MSNFLNNTTDLEKIYNEVDGIDELITEQNDLIAQIAAALDGEAAGGGSSPIYGEITTSSNSVSITIPAIAGKTNVMLSYLGSATTSSSKAFVACIDLQGSACSHTISYYNELYGTDDASLMSYDSSTGTFALTSAYNESFGAGKYTYVAW